MEPIRVLLAQMPAILRDILRRAIAEQADMTVAGEIADLDQLPGIGDAAAPDVVIVGLDEKELPPPCLRLLEARPGLKILVVAAGGREAVLHQSSGAATSVAEVSAEGILRAIRDAVRGNGRI